MMPQVARGVTDAFSRGCEVGRGLERPASCLGAWSKEFLRWIKGFWATRPRAYSHSRHARYPGVSGSSQSETFRPMLTFMGTVLDEADGVGIAGRTYVLRALAIGARKAASVWGERGSLLTARANRTVPRTALRVRHGTVQPYGDPRDGSRGANCTTWYGAWICSPENPWGRSIAFFRRPTELTK